MKPIRASWRLAAAGLQLALILPGVLSAQDQYAIATGFGTVVRVFAITSSGEISVHRTLTLAQTTEQVEVDTGGRFAFFVTGPASPVYRLGASGELAYQGSFGPPASGFGISATSRIVPQRSSLLVFSANQSNLAEVRLYDAPVNNRLQVHFEPGYLDLTGLPLSSPVDGVVSSFDPFTFFICVGDDGDPLRFVRLDPSASLSLTPQTFTDLETPGRPSCSGDGHLVAFPQRLFGGLGVVRLVGGGSSSVEFVGRTQIPGLSLPVAAALHPTGRWAFVAGQGGVFSVELNPVSGQFIGVVDHAVAGGIHPLAISPDGRFLISGSQAILIRVNDDGTLDNLNGSGVPGVPSLSDIAFIPPRTQPTLLGDANLDGLVDSADVTFLINEAMPDDKPILYPPNFANADLDQDVDVDQDDLESLVQLLLGE